ncbi:MAG: carboxypeptidase-like regulatory domain-containing protein [Bacteroidetes bacterium]|nr:carboxypeptidase-like regulatory domain-containing protein [Bacteroidota bacterium]
MFKLSSLLIILLLSSIGYSQNGRISGTILDSKTGETLPGATVLIEGTHKGAQADFDGKFSINNVSEGKVNILVSYISYTTKKITDVTVKSNDVTEINVKLDASSSQDLSEVEVVVTLNKENNTALVLQQKNNSSVSDGISAETIRRSPDRNTSDVLKRVSGVTIQDDKFVIVRGLNERYNASYLNGAPLPSTEPDRKAFAFNLFPANMLDNIVVNKTATPDMPSEFAGGIVQVNTKSIPEKNFLSFTIGGGYNTITTGKEKITYAGGKLDKFGFDDGSRDLSADVPVFKDKALWIASPDQARVATYFKNDWATSATKFKPNTNFQLAAGYTIKRKEKNFFGIIFSLGYNSNQSFYHNDRTEYDVISITGNNTSQPQVDQSSLNKVYQTQTSTGALLNLAFKLNDNNAISLKNLATGSADNTFIQAINTFTLGAPGIINKNDARYFTANKILSSQLNGEHFIPKAKIKINWTGGLSIIQRTVPNLRFMSYTKNENFLPYDPSEGPNLKDTMWRADISSSTGPNYSGFRVYSKLNETIRSGKVDISRLFKLSEKVKLDVKAGGLMQYRERQYNIRQFGVDQFQWQAQGVYKNDSLLYLPEGEIFAQQNMSVTPLHTGGFKQIEYTKTTDNYYGESYLSAGYLMGELKVSDKLRVITGARYENYLQKIIIKERFFDSVYVNSRVKDLLPSINVIYNITEKVGLRLVYYKTLNRPEFRELAVTNWYEPESRLSLAGNSSLIRCYIRNYDARFEYYPGKGQLFTVTGFYKYFNSPIERYMLPGSENQIYYNNAPFANVYGSELEYRINVGSILKKDSVKFLNKLNLFSNLALIKSIVNVAGLNSAVKETRTMQGQSPYIINSGISYTDTKNAFSITTIVNRIGERIYIVGNDQMPNRWENARTVLDLQLSKSFLKNKLELRFNIKDLLHQNSIIYYKGNDRKSNAYNKEKDFVNFNRTFGSTYSFVISYRF